MDTITAKILVFFLSLFILIVVAHQVAMIFDDDYETETAILYSSAEKVSFKGIYVRNESVVTCSSTGVLSYPNADGSKIAKDSVVAYVYKSENDIFINQQIEKLKEEVELLEKAQSPGTTDVVRAEFISGLIDEKYQTVTSLIAKNDLNALAEERKNFQSLLGIYQIVIKEESDYNDRIDKLNKQISELEAKKTEPVDIVTVPNSGYFISYTDGYENILSTESIGNVTQKQIDEIIENDGVNKSRIGSKTVGKIVDGYEWNMIGIVDTTAYDFKVGNTVSVKLSSTPDVVSATIDEIKETENPKESVIILSFEKLNYNYVQRRVERVELVLNDYNGIKIPRDAIRFNRDNEKGVYILLGQKISFKKIDVIFECDEYLLSKPTSDSGYISMYDDIIVGGEISADAANSIEASQTTSASQTVTSVSSESTDSQTSISSGTDTSTGDDETYE